MIRIIFILIAIITCSISVVADRHTDSYIRIEHMKDKIEDQSLSPVARMNYADSVLYVYKKEGNDSLYRQVLQTKGEIAYTEGYYTQAIECYKKLVESHSTGKAFTGIEHFAMSRLERLYYYKGWYMKSMAVAFKIINSDDHRRQPNYYNADAYNQLTRAFIRMRDHETAEFYIAELERMLPSCSMSKLEKRDILFLLNINKAALLIDAKNYQAAFPLIKAAERYASSEEQNIAVISDKGLIYVLLGDNKFAEECFRKIEQMPSSHYLKSVALLNYALLLYRENRFGEAEEVIAACKRLLAVQDIHHLRSALLRVEADIFYSTGNYADGYKCLRQAIEINDSILSASNIRQIMKLANEQERYKLLASIDRLDIENRTHNIIIIIAGVLILILLLFILMVIIKTRKKSALIELLSSKIRFHRKRYEKDISHYEVMLEDKRRELNEYVTAIGKAEKALVEINNIVRNSINSANSDKRIEQIITVLNQIGIITTEEGDASDTYNSLYLKIKAPLLKSFPTLTKSEIAMCAFILMDTSNKEIAAIRNTSVRTVENTKYRMYKKLNVPADTSVKEFLLSML